MLVKKKSSKLRETELREVVTRKRKSASTKSSTVHQAVKNIKLLRKKREEPKPVEAVEEKKIEKIKEKKIEKIKEKKEKKKNSVVHSTKGVVYLGRIPHGFYEEQMEGYFKQFGKVTRVRVVRSRNTGNSRGYGYIEFEHPEVAKVAAETMNNYLMCGRLLKATYIPPEKQHNGYFLGKEWSKQYYPKLKSREKEASFKNGLISKGTYEKRVQRSKKHLSALEKKLKEKGINLTFNPVGVSET